MANSKAQLEKITAWAKRRGFVFPASDIYGGLANTYDWGPYGTQLKENLRNLWWKRFIQERGDIYGIDSTIILKPDVWEASGHTSSFADVMVEDKVNHRRHRADHLIEESLEKLTGEELNQLFSDFDAYLYSKEGKEVIDKLQSLGSDQRGFTSSGSHPKALGIRNRKVDGLDPDDLKYIIDKLKLKSPDGNELTEPKRFNQLFETKIGIISGEKNSAYLRGEIAQGLFLNFKNILDSMHPKLPFGIGQAGKAFRNEITMGKFTFRTLEFDLMEFEYFFDPEVQNWNELFEMWKSEMHKFALEIGLNPEHLRWREHEEFERSHYSSRTEDLEYEFPWGFKEMWGLAYRTDFDLKNHMEKSGQDLQYTYPDGKKKIPHVVEPTFGLSRLATVMMIEAYDEETLDNGNTRTVLRFKPNIAPVQVAIFPLQKKGELAAKAEELHKALSKEFRSEFDNSGNIGKMYRKQDEIGTPYCVTIDFETLEDSAVTVRDRDTMKQERIKIEELISYLHNKFTN